MNQIHLGKTGLKVSPICMGTGHYGTGTSRELSFRQLDEYTELGANFIDTAHVYGEWVPGEKSPSEKTIGEWLHLTGKRDRLVIMTKGGHPKLETMHISRCTPEDIKTDIAESLEYLGVDCIDLYVLHRDNPALPVESLLEVLEITRLQGKIGHYGFSNWKLPRILEAEACAARMGIEGFTCNQAMWSLAEINTGNIPDKTMIPMDGEMYKWHCGSGVSVTAYNSTAKGFFSKLEKGQEISDKQKSLYDNEKNRLLFSLIKRSTEELGVPALAFSLGYMRKHPFPSVPITAFSKKNQLQEAIAACETNLPDDMVAKMNALKGLNRY